jgi:hypothetical protein
MNPVPIACTLRPDRMPARLAVIDGLAADALLERIPTATGLHVRLRDTADIERRTRELMAAEAQSCPLLTFALHRDEDALVLDVTGPPEAQGVIEMIFASEARRAAP